jgi:Rieske Fe-S protein
MPSAFPDGLSKVPGTTFLIGRDADGIYAMSAICTHQSCNMNKFGSMSSAGVRCVCHMSEFALDGSVTVGPAMVALNHFAVGLGCDGTIRVDTMTIVDKATRLAV